MPDPYFDLSAYLSTHANQYFAPSADTSLTPNLLSAFPADTKLTPHSHFVPPADTKSTPDSYFASSAGTRLTPNSCFIPSADTKSTPIDHPPEFNPDRKEAISSVIFFVSSGRLQLSKPPEIPLPIRLITSSAIILDTSPISLSVSPANT